MFVKTVGGVPGDALSRTHTHTLTHTHVDLEMNPWVTNAELKINMLSTRATPPHFPTARVWPFGLAASFFFF